MRTDKNRLGEIDALSNRDAHKKLVFILSYCGILPEWARRSGVEARAKEILHGLSESDDQIKYLHNVGRSIINDNA